MTSIPRPTWKGVLRAFLTNNRHALAMIPFLLGSGWFFLLEREFAFVDRYIQVPLDGMIPFVPAFVIPYVLWYLYIAATLLFLFFRSPSEFSYLAMFLGLGMLVSCCVFALYPNGQLLRPNNPGDGLFGDMIRRIYRADTNTNSLPSIHVIYSVGVHIAIARQTEWKRRWVPVRLASFILCGLICASTVFIKQHSIVDVVAGLAVSFALYCLVYRSRFLLRIYEALGVHYRLLWPVRRRAAQNTEQEAA